VFSPRPPKVARGAPAEAPGLPRRLAPP